VEAKFGGLEVSEAKRLKALEDENTRLKRCWPDDAALRLRMKAIAHERRRAELDIGVPWTIFFSCALRSISGRCHG
jgi:hypothetical protein